jgi:hypothetical protein
LPRFDNASDLHHARAGNWSAYFAAVYGELPASSFPLCVADLKFFYSDVLSKHGLMFPADAENSCPQGQPEDRPWTWSHSKEPPWTLSLLVLPTLQRPNVPVPHDTWVEVAHRSRSYESGWERDGMWFYITKGSGVWFNTGRTIAFGDHSEGFKHFGVSAENDLAAAARAKGIDSVQFTNCDGIQDSCCSAIGAGPCCGGRHEFQATRLVGNYACGTKAPQEQEEEEAQDVFRSGWDASAKCTCDEKNWGTTADPGDPWAKYVNCESLASHNGQESQPARTATGSTATRRAQLSSRSAAKRYLVRLMAKERMESVE